MENVKLRPWVGSLYNSTGLNGRKLMILGESHYCGDCDTCKKINEKCDFTTWVIENYLLYKNGKVKFAPSMNTFTKFVNVFYGKHCNREIITNFWNSIIFYNYVQKSLKGPRMSPTNEMFKNSLPAFYEILKEYNPDIIIIWGERLWNNLPKNGYWSENKIFDEKGGKLYFYNNGKKNIPAYLIYHPSSSYFGYKYSKYLLELMKII